MITNPDKLVVKYDNGNGNITKPGIYIIENLVNHKVYVGQAYNVLLRWYCHQHELIHNVHYNKHLQRSFNKHGIESFQFVLLKNCYLGELDTEEIKCIKEYREQLGKQNVYNTRDGGEGGRFPEEHYEKISETFRKRREILNKRISWILKCYPWIMKWKMYKKKELADEFESYVYTDMDESELDILNVLQTSKWAYVNNKIPEICAFAQEYKLPPWTRETLRQQQLGKRLSKEIRHKQSLSLKGKGKGISVPQERRERISATLTGRKVGPRKKETTKKIVETKLKRHHQIDELFKVLIEKELTTKASINWRLIRKINTMKRYIHEYSAEEKEIILKL